MLIDQILIEPNIPTGLSWKQERNKWLEFILSKGQLKRFLPRLNAKKTQSDEAFAEIFSAFYLETQQDWSVTDWEVKTQNNRDVDFVAVDTYGEEIFCEVKSPGWESELEQQERLSGRTTQSKYISGDGRGIAPWRNIRHAIRIAYPKFLADKPSLLIINDDLFVPISDHPLNLEIALFEESGIYKTELGNKEVGYFTDNRFENLGGVLAINCAIGDQVEYKQECASNPQAKKKIVDLK